MPTSVIHSNIATQFDGCLLLMCGVWSLIITKRQKKNKEKEKIRLLNKWIPDGAKNKAEYVHRIEPEYLQKLPRQLKIINIQSMSDILFLHLS